jgi:hypothetical protein
VVVAKVIVWKNKTSGKMRNFINGWLPAEGAAVAPKAAAKPAAAKPAAVGGAKKKMPWAK